MSASDKRSRRNAKKRGNAWEARIAADLAALGLQGEGQVHRIDWSLSTPDVTMGPWVVEAKARREGPPSRVVGWLEAAEKGLRSRPAVLVGGVVFCWYADWLALVGVVAAGGKAQDFVLVEHERGDVGAPAQITGWLDQCQRYADTFADARIPVVAVSNMPGRGCKRTAIVAMKLEYFKEVTS